MTALVEIGFVTTLKTVHNTCIMSTYIQNVIRAVFVSNNDYQHKKTQKIVAITLIRSILSVD